MSYRDTFWDALTWLRALGTNLYFWGGMLGLFTIGLGVYLLVDSFLMPSYTRHHVSTQVPDVEKLPFDKAKTRLEKKDLRVQRQVGRYNPNVDTGIVVDQTPLPSSKVKPGRRVYLTVNSGEIPTVKIPDFTGMSIREAKNRVSSLGLEVGRILADPVPSPYAKTITKQRPSPGDSLQEGSVVNLWYSTGLGEREVEVPNVVGLPLKEADRTLLQKELRSVVVDTASTQAEESDVPETRMPADTAEAAKRDTFFVKRQARSPGSRVRAGTEIRLYTTKDSKKAEKLREKATADSSAASAADSASVAPSVPEP